MRLKMRQPLVSGFGTGDRLAQTLSCIVQGHPYTDEVPYRVEPDNNGRWVLDEGNNWRLTICTDQLIVISSRYGGEDELFPWLQHKYGMTKEEQ